MQIAQKNSPLGEGSKVQDKKSGKALFRSTADYSVRADRVIKAAGRKESRPKKRCRTPIRTQAELM